MTGDCGVDATEAGNPLPPWSRAWRSAPRRHAPRRKPGFTLLELIIVMAIVAITAGLVVPTLRNFGEGRRVSESATQMVAVANFARTQAINESVVYRLNLDTATNTYWLTARRGGEYASPGGSFGRVFTAPDGVTLDWDAPQYPEGRYVEFYPTGRVTPVVIELTDRGGAVTTVACPSSAESFSIIPKTTKAG
jgi:prepilin-type N-terminal cleavage/methylation domain-containing protein